MFWASIDFRCMDKNGLKYVVCFAEENKQYRFGMTWDQVNGNIYIFFGELSF